MRAVYTYLTRISLLLLFLVGFQSHAQNVNWVSWEEAVQLSQTDAQPKKIFIDVYTDWCGWCKKMDRDTYADADIKKLISDNAVAIKINPEKNNTYKIGDNTYTGTELMKFLAGGKLYKSYPTTYFWLDPANLTKGRKKYMQMGYLDKAQMTEVMNKMIKIKKN